MSIVVRGRWAVRGGHRVYLDDGGARSALDALAVEPLEALDARPEDVIHVGNSLEADVAGAAGVGISSVWVTDGTDPGDVRPDYQVAATADLFDLSPFE